MSLTGKQEYYWVLRIVHNLAQALQVGKQQVSTLVSSKAAAETDYQCVRIHTLEQRNHTRRIALVLQPLLAELLLDIVEQLVLQCHTCGPNLLIRTVIDAVPDLLVALVAHVLSVEVLSIHLTPLGSTPCGEVNTVGNITHVVLLGIVAGPDRCKHLLAYPAVQH